MDEKEKVANTEVKETPAVEPTPPQTTEKPTTDSGTVAKEIPSEVSDRLDKNPRFQEVNERMKNAEAENKEFKAREAEEKYKAIQQRQNVTQTPEQVAQDPYAGMSAEEREQTRNFIDKFVKPEVRKEYEPFIQKVQKDFMDKQYSDGVNFASKYGIDLKQKLPEVISYLDRPENKGRLNLTEAVRNLYFEQITSSVKTNTAEEISKEKEELMEKKKQANVQISGVSPSSVVQSEEMARKQVPKAQRLAKDIKDSIELARKGEKNPKVQSNQGDNLYNY